MLKVKREKGRQNKGEQPNTMVIVGIGVVIAIVLIGLIIFFASRKTLGEDAAKLASYFPENTSFYASLDLSEDKLKKLERLSGDSLSLENIITSLKENSANPEQAEDAIEMIKEFKKSIEPKFSFGTWGKDNDQNGDQNFVVTTIVKDKKAIPELIKKITDNEIEFSKTKIDGLEVNVGAEDKGGAYVVIDDVLVLANDLDTLKAALETNKQKKSIVSSPKVVDVLLNLPEDRFLTILFNAADVSRAAEKKSADISKAMQISQIASTMSYTGIGIDVEDEVIIAKSYTPYNLNSVQDPELRKELNSLLSTETNMDAPKILPADTFAYVSMGGISHLIKTLILLSEADQSVDISQYTEKLKQTTNLDFEKDLLPIFSKEMTVAGLYSNKEIHPVIALTDQPTTLQVLNKLSTVLLSDPTASVVEKRAANNTIKVIGGSMIPIKVAFGKVGNIVLLGKAESVLAVASNVNKNLSGLKLYDNLSKQLVNNPNLVFYVNTDKLEEVLIATNKDPSKLARIQELNENVSGLMMSFTNVKQKAMVGNLFIEFKKNQKSKKMKDVKTPDKG